MDNLIHLGPLTKLKEDTLKRRKKERLNEKVKS